LTKRVRDKSAKRGGLCPRTVFLQHNVNMGKTWGRACRGKATPTSGELLQKIRRRTPRGSPILVMGETSQMTKTRSDTRERRKTRCPAGFTAKGRLYGSVLHIQGGTLGYRGHATRKKMTVKSMGKSQEKQSVKIREGGLKRYKERTKKYVNVEIMTGKKIPATSVGADPGSQKVWQRHKFTVRPSRS